MVYFLFYKVGTDGAADAVNNSSSHPQKYGYSKRVILYYTATMYSTVTMEQTVISTYSRILCCCILYDLAYFATKPFGTDTANIFFYKDTKL